MKHVLTLSTRLVAAVVAAAILVPAAVAAPRAEVVRPDTPVIPVAANCYAVGQQVAAQNGGELLNASAESRNGQTVCHVVVRIPGKDGQRPRRAEFSVPAN